MCKYKNKTLLFKYSHTKQRFGLFKNSSGFSFHIMCLRADTVLL